MPPVPSRPAPKKRQPDRRLVRAIELAGQVQDAVGMMLAGGENEETPLDAALVSIDVAELVDVLERLRRRPRR